MNYIGKFTESRWPVKDGCIMSMAKSFSFFSFAMCDFISFFFFNLLNKTRFKERNMYFHIECSRYIQCNALFIPWNTECNAIIFSMRTCRPVFYSLLWFVLCSLYGRRWRCRPTASCVVCAIGVYRTLNQKTNMVAIQSN